MYADTLKLRYTEQDGKPCPKLRTPRDDYGITAFRNRRAAFHLVGTVGIVAPGGFEGVAEILVFRSGQVFVYYLAANIEPTNGVGQCYNVTKLLCDVFGCGAYLSFTPVVAVGLANPSVAHPSRDDHTHGCF